MSDVCSPRARAMRRAIDSKRPSRRSTALPTCAVDSDSFSAVAVKGAGNSEADESWAFTDKAWAWRSAKGYRVGPDFREICCDNTALSGAGCSLVG